MSQSTTHSARSKRWGCSPFVAEWLPDAVNYVKTPQGYNEWVKWVREWYEQDESDRYVSLWKRPPAPLHPRSWYQTPNEAMFCMAGHELGVHGEALGIVAAFAMSQDIRSPPRTKPAIRRRRGEDSQAYLIRKHESLLAGCKFPNFDWENAQTIAMSQLDAVKEEANLFRTDIIYFLAKVEARSTTVIPHPQPKKIGGKVEEMHRIDQSFKSTLRSIRIAHVAWSYMVDLCDYLATQGLMSANSIETAYRKDLRLFYRIAGAFARLTALRADALGEFREKAIGSPPLKKYVKTYRTEQGTASVEKDREFFIGKHDGGYDTPFDELMVQFCSGKRLLGEMIFIENINNLLKENPEEAVKLSQDAFDALGDLCIVSDIHTDLVQSSFGRTFMKYTKEMDRQRSPSDTKIFEEIVSPCDVSKVPNWQHYNGYRRWGDASALLAYDFDSIITFFAIDSQEFIMRFLRVLARKDLPVFDDLWHWVDKCRWDAAKQYDYVTGSQKGRFVRELGLFDPDTEDRPKFIDLAAEMAARLISPPPVSAHINRIQLEMERFASSIPVAALSDTLAQSGHAYRSKDQPPQKDKKKSRISEATGGNLSLDELNTADDGAEKESELLPLTLPDNYKIGKKALKVFNRILEARPEFENEGSEKQRKGQLSWADFEKAMKRVGFAVVQTAGSSVRFDPPAVSARPIAFHRPHPDSILTPSIIRSIGARLRKCYGWTTATFVRMEGERSGVE